MLDEDLNSKVAGGDGADPMVSIVVPVYDERDALPGLIEEIDAMAAKSGLELEMIFVDDGSADGTGAYLSERASEREDITVIVKTDGSGIAAVQFGQHGGRYMRIAGPRDAPCTAVGHCDGHHGFAHRGAARGIGQLKPGRGLAAGTVRLGLGGGCESQGSHHDHGFQHAQLPKGP